MKKTIKQLAEDFAAAVDWDGVAVLTFAAHALRDCNFESEAVVVDGLRKTVEAQAEIVQPFARTIVEGPKRDDHTH